MPSASVLFVLAVALLFSSTSANDADTVHASFTTGSVLNAAEPKYVVGLDLNVAARNAEVAGGEHRAGTRNVVIADHAGTRFSCELPEFELDAGAQQAELGDAGGAGRHRTVAELMEDIANTCFYRVEGWWTFELCVRKHVRQFHQEKDVVVSEYVLGRFDEAATARLHEEAGQPFSEEASPTGAALRYHAHVFDNGTACDLTGEPRSTEVRFVCAPEAVAAQVGVATPAHFIESVKEPVTCHYVLTLATPLLCAHAAFRVEEAPVAHIRCRATAHVDEGEIAQAARAGDGGAGAVVGQEQGAAVAGARDEL